MIIKCMLPAKSDIFLSKLIDGISTNYFWHIYDDEVYLTVDDNISIDSEQLFSIHRLRGTLLKNISFQQPYWIISCKLLATEIETNQEIGIYTYNQFVQSDYNLVISISDTQYVTVFVKKRIDYNIILSNMAKWSFHNITCFPVLEDYKI